MAWSDGLVHGSPSYLIAASENARLRAIAGPGTGKSYAMKRRVARLLESGVAPASILPVTFTRVAAEDLHRELSGMGVPGCDQLNGVTLHSLAMKVLMRNHVLDATGRKARPLNDFELEPLICDLMAQHGGKRDVKRLKQAYEAGWARLQHELPGHVANPADAMFATNLIDWLHFHEAMLIGEVIPLLYEYLRLNPLAPERTEFAHILVDEYQDLNKVEQGVIALLSDAAHVCIVGDDDQSIYSFKHAHPLGIQDWMTINNTADDLNLLECWRCPTRVVEMANSLISHNTLRLTPRVLMPIPAKGNGVVNIVQYANLDAEVAGVATQIRALIGAGTPPGDILVLAQRSAIGTPIYMALLEQGVPVKSYYSESELDNLEAKRRFAMFKLLVNRDDRVALRWLVGINSANYHAAGYRRIREHSEATGLSPWDVFSQLSSGTLSLPYTNPIVAEYESILNEINGLDGIADLSVLVDTLFPDGEDGVAPVRAHCLSALQDNPDDREALLGFLIDIIAKPEVPEVVEDVRIMSLHKSKGLSSPVTFICGCVEGLLPKQPEAGTPNNQAVAMMEEQRRLFFVGISRVKASPPEKPGTLILTNSQQMPLATALGAGISPAASNYGTAQLIASRFIQELGPSAPDPVAG